MNIVYCRCSACGAKLRVDWDAVAGDPICPKCGAPLVIPRAPSGDKLPVAAPLEGESPGPPPGEPARTSPDKEAAEAEKAPPGKQVVADEPVRESLAVERPAKRPASDDETEAAFPHIVTDAPTSGEAPSQGSTGVRSRGRTGDRTFRLGLAVSAVCVLLLAVAMGAFAWLAAPRDAPSSRAPSAPRSPATQPAGKEPAADAPRGSTLVLDWPEHERRDAAVFIDGAEFPVPSSGEAEFAVEPGQRTVLVERRGYEPVETRLRFEAGAHHHFRPHWKPMAVAMAESEKSEDAKAAEPKREEPSEPPRDREERPDEKPKEPPPRPEEEGREPKPDSEPKPAPSAPTREAPAEKAAPKSKAAPASASAKPTARADFDSPEAFLASRGLRRLSNVFALAEETEVSARLREAESLRKKAFGAQQKATQAQQVVDEKKRLMLNYVQQSRELGAKLPLARNVEQHNQIVTALNELDARILIMRESKQEEQALEKARAAATTLREEFVEQLLGLRQAYEEVGEGYEALAADAAVGRAMEEYSETASKTYRLGPTTVFAGMENKLARLEEMVLSESIPLRRGQGNLWYVDVVFNGRKTQEMAIDTGASVIALSWDVANKVGLAPGDDAPGVLVEVADGRVVEAKRVLAKTVRVGKFTAENVECAVLPGGLPRTTPLLGLSFFKNFSFKIDSGNGKLIMSQIETATGQED